MEARFEISHDFRTLVFICFLATRAAKLAVAISSADQPERPVTKIASCFHDAFLACRMVQWL
jgi:hypothetical protein